MIKTLTQRIADEETRYWKAIDEIAIETFEQKVKPYLQAHGMYFMAGNGSFVIWNIKNGKEHTIYTEELPKWLQNILEQELINDANCLGTLMPDYLP